MTADDLRTSINRYARSCLLLAEGKLEQSEFQQSIRTLFNSLLSFALIQQTKAETENVDPAGTLDAQLSSDATILWLDLCARLGLVFVASGPIRPPLPIEPEGPPSGPSKLGDN